MNPESEEAKTRRFLEDLIDRRRTQPTADSESSNEDPQQVGHQQQQLQQEKEEQLQNQELQRRRQLMGLLAARQAIGSPRLTSIGSASSTGPTNFANEALRRVDEISGLRRSSLGSSFADIMPTTRATPWGSSSLGGARRLGSSLGDGGALASGSLFPSLVNNLNDPTLTAKGVVPWAVSSNHRNERQKDDLRKHPQALSSLVEAVSRETAAITAASRKKPAAKRRKTIAKISELPKLKDSSFFLPALPSSAKRASRDPFQAPMKSYKALWRNRMSVLVSPEVRREIFCRAVSRGRVQIQDGSRTLPPLQTRRRA